MKLSDSASYQKLKSATNLPLIQYCRLINQLLTEFNKPTFTREDIVSMFKEAYEIWIYQEYINDYATTVIKKYLQVVSNVDEQILNAITTSILNNLRYDDLRNEFIHVLEERLISILNDLSILTLPTETIEPSYFGTLVKKYELTSFTDYINYVINSLMSDEDKAERPLNPTEFQYLTDEEDPINHEVTSTIKPIDFADYRTAAVVVLDDLALIENKSHTDILKDHRERCKKQKIKSYNAEGENILEEFNISTLAIGSTFGKVVLLEYITGSDVNPDELENASTVGGDFELVKKALRKKGYQKIYLQKSSPFLSRRYIRKAKKQI